jgi:hypothetical protein
MEQSELASQIQKAVSEQLSDLFRYIYGPIVKPEDILVNTDDTENPTVTITLPVYIVKEDNYIGLSTY